jgi:2-polyprenyl-3-methyl-5-hydroxy-6-metoxy-1,4-benzoquinol methylase/tetratricopeptide (TPR) repeat protein
MSQTELKTAKTWQVEGAARYRAGDLPGAIEALTEAARCDPQEPAYLLNLAQLARESGRFDEARQHLERATAITGADVGRLNLLAGAWLDLGAFDPALDAAIRAIGAGGDATSRRLFVDALRAPPRPETRSLVALALREGWGRHDTLSAPVTGILRAAWPATLEGLAQDPLLAEALVSLVLRDPALEQRLTTLRKTLLLDGASDALIPLLARLATQCHLNEYAWAVSPEEDEAVQALARHVALGAQTAVQLLTLACFQALGDTSNADALLRHDWPEPVRRVLDEQVVARNAERVLAAETPALTPIRRGVSEQVRAQYEENPYPRWTRIPAQQPAPMERILRATLPHADLQPLATAPEVLIAGCGSGQHAIQAARRSDGVSVLAVDLSRASLGYARRKAAEAGITNITFAQADLLELGATGRTFDIIECVGVLHHLSDPFEGAQVLTSLLRPGGVMKLGLYSAAGRAPLAAAKALAKRYPPSAEGIRALRAAIQQAPAGDPVRVALGIGDFYAISTCRDLLMHVQEHVLDIGDVRRMAAENGLRFLGFALPPGLAAAYRRAFPQDASETNFDNWAAFEQGNPTAFAAMYQFWVQKPV